MILLKFIKTLLQRINVIVIIGLLLIHFILKENNYVFSLLYYSFPLPIIIAIIAFLSLFLKKKVRIYNLILVLILLGLWFGRSFKINEPGTIHETDIEVVFWNATHKRELKHVFEKVDELPDLIVLVEYHAEELEETKLKLPDCYYYWHEDSEIGVFSKKPIDVKKVFISEDETAVINFTSHGINFYAIDVASSMNVFRKNQIAFVQECVASDKKTIILGDFNTPLESKFLKDIENNFSHVLNEKGNGFRETWFWNLPLLSLDHIWVSKDLKILNAEKIATFKSDHSMIKAVIKR
jgi:hypothetical protein